MLIQESERLCIFFTIKLVLVVLQKSVVLLDFFLDVRQTSNDLRLLWHVRIDYIVCHMLLFKSHDELVANSHNVRREISPLYL